MGADVDQLVQAMQGDPSMGMGMPPAAAPAPLSAMAGPMMPPMPGGALGMGGVGPAPFPSTDPGALAMAVQDALANLAAQDTMQLEMQQQQAAMAAQPIIDQMMSQAAMPADPMMGMGADPMLAMGEGGLGLPPLPPEAMVA